MCPHPRLSDGRGEGHVARGGPETLPQHTVALEADGEVGGYALGRGRGVVDEALGHVEDIARGECQARARHGIELGMSVGDAALDAVRFVLVYLRRLRVRQRVALSAREGPRHANLSHSQENELVSTDCLGMTTGRDRVWYRVCVCVCACVCGKEEVRERRQRREGGRDGLKLTRVGS